MTIRCGINRQRGYIEFFIERVSIEWARRESAGGWPYGNPMRRDFNWWWLFCFGRFEINRQRSQMIGRLALIVWSGLASERSLYWGREHCSMPLAYAKSVPGI